MKKKNEDISSILKEHSGIKLDIGCGASKQPGFIGMDYRELPGVDIVHNLEKFPWPLPDKSVLVALSSHVVEHINPHGGTFIDFMNEAWRVLKEDGEFLISTPYAGSPGYWWDPTHCNGCTEMTWEYFDPLSPLTGGQFYNIYKPLPWKIKTCFWDINGNLEVVLVKRKIDKSYKVDEHYLKNISKPKTNVSNRSRSTKKV